MKRTAQILAVTAFAAAIGLAGIVTAHADDQKILNVSYDPTRELYQEYNDAFAKHWATLHPGSTVEIQQSHGGSGAQAQAVVDGLGADVVTLALQGDVDRIAKAGLIDKNWQSKLPDRALPYTSTIVFLVRKGNPKGIHDWPDLIKDGVQVVLPNPKTSGGARWAYLGAWAWAAKQYNNDEAKEKDFVKQLYSHAPVLDSGARGSTVTFAQKQIGDVLVAWENEAYLALDEFGADQFDIVVPPQSMLAEPPVAVVDKNVDAHGTRAVATEYLKYLYSPEGQTLAAKNHYRPSEPDLVTDKSLLSGFPKLTLISIDDPIFGGWAKVGPKHFGDGGIFDQIYKPGN
ncbi:MAG TPA: sulfate ABC transporter substrate-binding protein [Devosiaceae bacterium]|nr:sulfate ABC transporter substrate-binding protein [Devosiaceae bacterium]